MPEVTLAGRDPLMPDTQGSHEVSKRGGCQHTQPHVSPATTCMGRLNALCANFYTSPDSFIVVIDFLPPSVNASLPFALISNSVSDGPYPSITGGDAAAGAQPCSRGCLQALSLMAS